MYTFYVFPRLTFAAQTCTTTKRLTVKPDSLVSKEILSRCHVFSRAGLQVANEIDTATDNVSSGILIATKQKANKKQTRSRKGKHFAEDNIQLKDRWHILAPRFCISCQCHMKRLFLAASSFLLLEQQAWETRKARGEWQRQSGGKMSSPQPERKDDGEQTGCRSGRDPWHRDSEQTGLIPGASKDVHLWYSVWTRQQTAGCLQSHSPTYHWLRIRRIQW